MCMTLITAHVQPCLWAIKHKDNYFLDVSVLWFCSVHALIQLADMQAYLGKSLERAFTEYFGGSTAFDEKVASH